MRSQSFKYLRNSQEYEEVEQQENLRRNYYDHCIIHNKILREHCIVMRENFVDKNYEWFKLKLPELVKEYDGRYVIIKDCHVIGAFATFDDAFVSADKNEIAGTYIIQLCSQDEAKTARTYHTLRVDFE